MERDQLWTLIAHHIAWSELKLCSHTQYTCTDFSLKGLDSWDDYYQGLLSTGKYEPDSWFTKHKVELTCKQTKNQ